jgi:hypothetical protein
MAETLPQRLEELYAFLSIDQAGNEGVMGGINPKTGMAFTLCFGNEHLAMEFIPAVQEICKTINAKARLVKFTGKVVLHELC